ncbi:hypothetical protein M0802_009033 [Mischocyttarus mexicanus]|nr:hypothetical protein M0802_009033 [Mischocyttarus mexicanus]
MHLWYRKSWSKVIALTVLTFIEDAGETWLSRRTTLRRVINSLASRHERNFVGRQAGRQAGSYALEFLDPMPLAF